MSNTQSSAAIQKYVRSGAVQDRINALLDKRAPQFTASLMSLVNSNPALQKCSPESVLKAAITAAAMDLPINPNLGFAYIIPYNNNQKVKQTITDEKGNTREVTNWVTTTEAQFQMGYKGFVQLAQRSGQYKTINVTDVREGEIESTERLSGDINFAWIKDEKERLKAKVIGYVAYFKLSTGFEKTLYMSVEELKAHGKKYSKSYAKGYGLWTETDGFAFMATKTVLKLLISKYGSMSTEMQQAILADQSAVEDEDKLKYVDNDKTDKDIDQTASEDNEAEGDQTKMPGANEEESA